MNKNFRSDINGLRAISVIAILIYHLNPSALIGGFAGVDIFFVVSGFLITQIVFKGINDGNFSFKNFYTRRIKRIFPALILVILLVIMLSILHFSSIKFLKIGEIIQFTGMQISNLFFIKKIGYFDLTHDFQNNPLLHTWSLGVEEQFYLIWPLMLVILCKFFQKRTVFFVVLSLSLISLVVTELLLYNGFDNYAFYFPFSRFWELSLGGLLALNIIPQLKNQATIYILNLVGIFVIIASFLLITDSHFPGIKALPSCLGAFLIIYSGTNNEFNIFCRISKIRLLTTIGLISYSLYLFHTPFIAFYKEIFDITILNVSECIFISLISLFVAYLSYRFIENPFKESLNNVKQLIISMLVIILIGSSFKMNFWNFRHRNVDNKDFDIFNKSYKMSSSYMEHANVKNCATILSPRETKRTCQEFKNFIYNKMPLLEKECTFGYNLQKPTALLFGNSHVFHIAEFMKNITKKMDNSAILFEERTRVAFHESYCGEGLDTIFRTKMEELYIQKNIKYIFISNNYANEFALKEIIETTKNLNKKIILFGTIPMFPFNIHRCAESQKKLILLKKNKRKSCFTFLLSEEDKSHMLNRAKLKKLAEQNMNVYYVDLFKYFCNSTECSSIQGGEFLYRDQPENSTHLNTLGQEYVSKLLMSDKGLMRFLGINDKS